MHLVVPKPLVLNISESKPLISHPAWFWIHLGVKYSRLTKFIQKMDPNARMLKIFSDLKQNFLHKTSLVFANSW